MSAVIELAHPVDVNGISIRFVPIRRPSPADLKEVGRAGARKWRGADKTMVAVIAARIEADDPQRDRKIATGFVGCALVRAVTGLPFPAIAQLTADDQAKIAAFLDNQA